MLHPDLQPEKFGTPNAQQLWENLSLVEFCKTYSLTKSKKIQQNKVPVIAVFINPDMKSNKDSSQYVCSILLFQFDEVSAMERLSGKCVWWRKK